MFFGHQVDSFDWCIKQFRHWRYDESKGTCRYKSWTVSSKWKGNHKHCAHEFVSTPWEIRTVFINTKFQWREFVMGQWIRTASKLMGWIYQGKEHIWCWNNNSWAMRLRFRVSQGKAITHHGNKACCYSNRRRTRNRKGHHKSAPERTVQGMALMFLSTEVSLT